MYLSVHEGIFFYPRKRTFFEKNSSCILDLYVNEILAYILDIHLNKVLDYILSFHLNKFLNIIILDIHLNKILIFF